MKRCIVITAYNAGKIKDAVTITPDDLVVCADGGYDLAKKEGITPSVVIGDMDSTNEKAYDCPAVTAPAEKDETDTLLCIMHGIKQGFSDFVIVGGIGGRLDHTMANLQLLSYCADKGVSARIADADTDVFMVSNGRLNVAAKEGFKLAVFSYTEKCRGVSVSGTKYTLKDAELTQSFPVGVSNEFAQDEAIIEVKDGKLFVMVARG